MNFYDENTYFYMEYPYFGIRVAWQTALASAMLTVVMVYLAIFPEKFDRKLGSDLTIAFCLYAVVNVGNIFACWLVLDAISENKHVYVLPALILTGIYILLLFPATYMTLLALFLFPYFIYAWIGFYRTYSKIRKSVLPAA